MSRTSGPRDPAKYDIGYGKPPAATRFQSGRSGNPRGRPKGSRTVQVILNDILGQKIPITENGKSRRVPAMEIMIRRLANAAMQGDKRAITLVFALNDRYGDSPDTTLDMAVLNIEDHAILARYLPEPDKPSAASAEMRDAESQSAEPFDEGSDAT